MPEILTTIDIEILGMLGDPLEIEIEALSPIPIEIGMILPGPRGESVEIYRSTELPDPEIGSEGALWIKYIEQI